MPAKIETEKYFKALERLIARGAPISNDAVAKEAKSGKGSIKKSRPVYAELIAAIEQAAHEQKQNKNFKDKPIIDLKNEMKNLREKLDAAYEREICLLHEVLTLREEILQLRQNSIKSINN